MGSAHLQIIHHVVMLLLAMLKRYLSTIERERERERERENRERENRDEHIGLNLPLEFNADNDRMQ